MIASRVVCIWYPSGGFGHFVNAILSLYGHDFVRPSVSEFDFGITGDSHSLELTAPKWFHDPDNYQFNFEDQRRYTVLIDNGINNEGTKFQQYFNTSEIVRIVYNDVSWPIIAKTNIVKAMKRSLDNELGPDRGLWPEDAAWAIREKYFLYLTRHSLQRAWRPRDDCKNLYIEKLQNYESLIHWLQTSGFIIDDFRPFHTRWLEQNLEYFEPMNTARSVLQSVYGRTFLDLTPIDDLWTQAVVNYAIYQATGFEVPANDYANWFTNTKQIVTMLEEHGVNFD